MYCLLSFQSLIYRSISFFCFYCISLFSSSFKFLYFFCIFFFSMSFKLMFFQQYPMYSFQLCTSTVLSEFHHWALSFLKHIPESYPSLWLTLAQYQKIFYYLQHSYAFHPIMTWVARFQFAPSRKGRGVCNLLNGLHGNFHGIFGWIPACW